MRIRTMRNTGQAIAPTSATSPEQTAPASFSDRQSPLPLTELRLDRVGCVILRIPDALVRGKAGHAKIVDPSVTVILNGG